MTQTLVEPPRRSTPKTMRAALITAPQKMEVVDAPVPAPKAGQLLVRLEGCGVCASNVPPWEGREWFEYPLAPGQLGHEGWGVVQEVGGGVSGFAAGDRVAVISNNAYAEYDVADAAAAVKLPPALDGQPFPAEPLGCAVNIFRRAEIRAGQTVAILGIGFLGALLTRLARNAGARVIAVSRRPFSLDFAKRFGAHEVVLMDDHWQIINRVAAMTDGSGGYDVKGFCDCVVECVGKEWPLQLAGELCGVRGRLVIAGYHQDGMRSVNVQLWNWRGLDVINAHERYPSVYLEGMQTAAELVARGDLDPRPLFTHAFALERLGDALEMTRARPDGFMKALVRT